MNLSEIKELMDYIAQSNLAEVHLKTEHIQLIVKRHPILKQSQELPPTTSPSLPEIPTQPTASPQQHYITIKSPMVGTFYRSESPNAAPFIQEGACIQKGQTIGIIEAMKLFNEIEADVTGKLISVLVEDASPVAYDQPLFLIDPA